MMSSQDIGDTIICKWKHGKVAAFSVGGDDSLRSQLYFAIPEMDKRGLRGTWWVNPGRGGSINYKNQDDSWAQCWIACNKDWQSAAAKGHDFANHSLHHLGAKSYQEAEYEISETAKIIWKTNPRQRLQLFLKGGGTTWEITDEELSQLLLKYDCVYGRGGGQEDPTWENNPSADTLKGYVDSAIKEGSWHLVAFHGIGSNCEWGGPVDGGAFIALLGYLVEKSGLVWTGTHTEVHKYDQERSTATARVHEKSSDHITLTLKSLKDPRLYDYPLTLRTKVPEALSRVFIKQKETSTEHPVLSGVVQYEAIPGMGDVRISFAK